jgi:integrase
MTGIQVRHTRSCKSTGGGTCNCKPSYRAWVYDRRSKQRTFKTFDNQNEAKSWRIDARHAVKNKTMPTPSKVRVREAGEALIDGMRSGTVRNKKGQTYKPSVTRGYEDALKDRIYPALGPVRLSDVQRRDVQRVVDEMLAESLSASTIANAIMPLRVIYRRAIEDDELSVSPCDKLRMPADDEKPRDRIAPPEEAGKLLDALSEADRALWASAMYAGLRAGELMALRWEDVDLDAGVIHVERSYDPKEHEIVQTKNRRRRDVPIIGALRKLLMEHKLRAQPGVALVFPRRDGGHFTPTSIRSRARTAWRSAKLSPITLHECRHTFASLMIHAGVNAKALSEFMGHSSIQITFDRYGHLMPGSRDEAVERADAYLSAAQLRHSEAQ